MFGRTFPPALILLLATIAGSSMDGTIKHLTQTNHILVVAFGRYVLGAGFSYFIYWRAGRPPISAAMWRAHSVRGIVIASCAVAFFFSLHILPLAEAITFSFLYPLLAPFVAWVVLKERVRASSMICALVGFAGVIVAMQGAPSEAESPNHHLGVISALCAATLFSITVVLLRERAQKDGAPIVSLMTSLVPAMLLAGPTLAFATPPVLATWPIYILMGAFAAAFMYLMTLAYSRAEAQQIAPIHYMELLWATAIGYVFFHETPRVEIYMGAALIIAACLWAAYNERRTSIKLKDQP